MITLPFPPLLMQNQDIDIESSFVEPWLRFIRNQRSNTRGVLLVWVLFNILIAPMEYIRRVRDVLTGRDGWRIEYIIPIAELACLALGAGLGKGVLLLLTMQAVVNTLLVIISTPVHRSAYAWTSGCEGVVPGAADYGLQIVLSTNDFLVDESPSLFTKLFLFASFNDHVTHHLFPTVDLSRQDLVRPIFLECCRRFNVPYRKTRYSEMLRTTFEVLLRDPSQLMYYPG